MSLKRCPSCNRRISTAATSCPKCGHPLSEEVWREAARKRKVGYLILLGLVAAGIFGCVQIPRAPTEMLLKSAEFGERWPFHSDTVIVRCRDMLFGETIRPIAVVFVGNQEWGLNGAAIGVGAMPRPTPWLKTDPRTGLKMDAGVIVPRALPLCASQRSQ